MSNGLDKKSLFIDIRTLIGNFLPFGSKMTIKTKLHITYGLFARTITNEHLLQEIMEYLTCAAMDDEDYAIKFASVITSLQFERFSIDGKKVRKTLMRILRKNFESKCFQ